MKRNLSKAILATVAALAGTQSALAQYDPNCWPTGANPVGPSTTYNLYELTTLLFGCAVGISGTDTYTGVNNVGGDPQCGNEVMTMGGRFGFTVGSTGSIQSTMDDGLSLTWGMPVSVGNSCGFAMVVTGALPTITRTLFGAPTTSFFGASNRYFQVESTVTNIDTTLRVDVVADAARFAWTLTNTSATATTPVGLMTGSWVQPAQLQPYDQHITYVYSPGYKPFVTEQLFQAANTLNQFPAAMMFAITQANAYGLQIVNSPLSAPNQYGINAPDQTPVDDLVIGQGWDVLNHDSFPNLTTTPAPPYPYIINTDVPFIEFPPSSQLSSYETIDDAAFLQFWYPTALPPGGSRSIISYYRSTWGVSDYNPPFAAVVDTPLAITTNAQNPAQFSNGQFDFRVYIDNVGGYANAGKAVTLNNLRVQVNLPQGMVDATNPTGPNAGTLVSFIPTIAPAQMGFQDFQVQVNSNISPGPQSYSVQITSNTGASKILYGTINVAGTPNLNIRQAANLVGVPWIFSASDWGTVLGLTANTDFQAFTWNPLLGQYVVAPNAVRGQGTFIVSQNDHGTISLGGNPQQDTNTTPSAAGPIPTVDPNQFGGWFGSASDVTYGQASGEAVTLSPGWNLICNPFNYVISLGQLLGIDTSNPNSVLTFAQMTQSNLISPSLAFYDPDSQGYNYISSVSDLMLPSTGYWVFCATQDTVQIVFPKVLAPFVKSATAPGWAQSENQWKLQLAVQNGKTVDAQNYIGVAPTAVSKLLTTRKPPTAPVPNAVTLNVQDTVNGKVVPLSQSLRSTGGNTQSWNVQVTSKVAAPVTINWPNLSTLPKDVQFQLTDVSSGATRDIRRSSAYTFNATAGATRSFTIAAVPGAASRAIITNLTASQNRNGGGVNVSYVLASSSTVSVRVLQNGRAIYQVLSGRAVTAGTNTASWALRDSANRTVAPGLYTIEITAEGADGDRVHRTIPVTITR